MKSEIYETPSAILDSALTKTDVDFLKYLAQYSKNKKGDKEDTVDIAGIDNEHLAVKNFCSSFITEFCNHECCYRKCLDEEELIAESQNFDGIPAGQYVLDKYKGLLTNCNRYEIIKVKENEILYICKTLFDRTQVINFRDSTSYYYQEGFFRVLKQDPYGFSHKSCQKQDCVAQDAPCHGDFSLDVILDRAIGTHLGSFCEHPFYGFFEKKVLRTEANEAINKFCIKGRFVLDTWERYEKEFNKHTYNFRELFSKKYSHYIACSLWALGSGIYLEKNISHSMQKKIFVSLAVGSLIGYSLYH